MVQLRVRHTHLHALEAVAEVLAQQKIVDDQRVTNVEKLLKHLSCQHGLHTHTPHDRHDLGEQLEQVIHGVRRPAGIGAGTASAPLGRRRAAHPGDGFVLQDTRDDERGELHLHMLDNRVVDLHEEVGEDVAVPVAHA